MKRTTLLTLACIALIGLFAQSVLAQTEEPPATTPITYGSKVEGDLTTAAFWDWWSLQANAGDRMIVEMTGEGGLAPLIGILDSNGALVARSDDGAPNSVVDISYTAPSTGRYTIVTTRTGNANGTTVGHYVLRLGHDNPSAPQPTPSSEVTFQCGPAEATSAISLRFAAAVQSESNVARQIVVVGFNGFDPVVRVKSDQSGAQSTCTPSSDGTDGDAIMLPGEAALYLHGLKIVRATLAPSATPGYVQITIGGVGGATGRYAVIMTGFSIDATNRNVPLEARLGPRAVPGADALVYMLAADGSRVDPSVTNADETFRCDDAGLRDCIGLPPAAGTKILVGDLKVVGHRFDAGMRIPKGTSGPQIVVMTSFDARTDGPFNVLVVGALTDS